MKLKTIQEDIAERFPLCECACGGENPDIRALLIGPGGSELTQVLHVFFGEVPADAPGTGSGDGILCLARYAPAAPNRILAPDEKTLRTVFNFIQGRLARAQALSDIGQRVMHGEATIQTIVDRATEIMENPLLVADTSFRIMGMSDMEIEDSAWKHFRERRQIPFHPDTARGHEQFLRDIRRGVRVSVVDGKHKKGFFIRVAAMFGELFLAQVHIFSMLREFMPSDIELAMQLGDILGIAIMRSAPDLLGTHTTSDYLISDLILGKLTDQGIIQARLEYVRWPLRRYKYLLVVRWERDVISINFQDAFISNLCRIFPDGRSVVDGEYIIVMFSRDSGVTNVSPELARVSEQIARSGQCGTLSFPFEELTDAAYRYEQAREILELNRRLGMPECFFMAESCAVELMISQAGTRYRLTDYCHPLIRRLLEYDDTAGRDYLSTLRAYIETGRSFTKAAERLHMHRNSVIYRMKQIEDILGYDFSREEFTFQFELSFRVLDHIRRERSAAPTAETPQP